MNLDELNARAEAGDVDAMMQLVQICMDKDELGEAVSWADSAAETGNLHSIYQAIHVHSVRMPKLVGAKLYSDIVTDDARIIRKHISYFFELSQKGLITLSSEVRSYLLSVQQNTDYYESLSCFYAEQKDDNRIVQLLKDDETTRARFLCAHAYADLEMYDEALEKMEAGYKDQVYCVSGKDLLEQSIYALVMNIFSGFVRVKGNPDRAVQILNRGLLGLENEELKEMLRKELAKYQKKMLGGWKYNG